MLTVVKACQLVAMKVKKIQQQSRKKIREIRNGHAYINSLQKRGFHFDWDRLEFHINRCLLSI